MMIDSYIALRKKKESNRSAPSVELKLFLFLLSPDPRVQQPIDKLDRSPRRRESGLGRFQGLRGRAGLPGHPVLGLPPPGSQVRPLLQSPARRGTAHDGQDIWGLARNTHRKILPGRFVWAMYLSCFRPTTIERDLAGKGPWLDRRKETPELIVPKRVDRCFVRSHTLSDT